MSKISKVSPDLAEDVIHQANGRCAVCGTRTGRGEIHHVIGRYVPATIDNLVYLCQACHRGENGVHGRDGHQAQLKLKIKLQEKYFRQGNTEEEVRSLMGGKIFLAEE